jgi:hypothetical protein
LIAASRRYQAQKAGGSTAAKNQHGNHTNLKELRKNNDNGTQPTSRHGESTQQQQQQSGRTTRHHDAAHESNGTASWRAARTSEFTFEPIIVDCTCHHDEDECATSHCRNHPTPEWYHQSLQCIANEAVFLVGRPSAVVDLVVHRNAEIE